MEFRKNHSFVELFSSKAREDLVFKNRKSEGKWVAVHVRGWSFITCEEWGVWEGGGGVFAAILRKLRRFVNQPPQLRPSFFFLEILRFEIDPHTTHPIDVETTNFFATNRALIQLQLTLVCALYFLN